MMFYDFLSQFLDPGSKNLVFWRSDSNSPWTTVYFPSWKGLEAKNLAQKCHKNKKLWFNIGRIYVWATDRRLFKELIRPSKGFDRGLNSFKKGFSGFSLEISFGKLSENYLKHKLNFVSGAGPSNLPGTLMYTASFSRRGAPSPTWGTKSLCT